MTAGSWHSADMNTGFFVCLRASAWKNIMKPQSPVIPETPSASSSFTLPMKRSSTSGVILPDWHIAKVRPGTTR